MTAYILKLLILVPLVAGLAFASIWLWRRVQPGTVVKRGPRAVRVVDGVPLGATGRLAVIEFGGKHLLVAIARGQVTLISEAEAPDAEFDLNG